MKGWIGVDLDGTLAEYESWISPDHIGEPIPAMVDRVKRWLGEGRDVRIFTARYSLNDPDWNLQSVPVIEAWCEQHLGQRLPVTCSKDLHMIELWDDRAVQVEANTGQPVGYSTRGL